MNISKGTASGRIYTENARDQDRDNRCVRACAMEMHMDISKGTVSARSCNKISETKTGTTVFSEKKPFMQEFAVNMPQTKTGKPVSCEPAQLKCSWTSQKRPFKGEFAMTMLQTKTLTTWRRRPCASLRFRNLHGRRARALFERIYINDAVQRTHLHLTLAFHADRKNPSVILSVDTLFGELLHGPRKRYKILTGDFMFKGMLRDYTRGFAASRLHGLVV